MNKREASVLLFIITFFSAIQYVFLSGVPSDVSNYAFICITYFIGLIITFSLFASELFRLDRKHVWQSFVLAAEVFIANALIMRGSSGNETTVTAAILTLYIAFVPLLGFFFFKEKPGRNNIIGIAVVIAGLALMMNFRFSALMNVSTLYLLAADVLFALLILSAGKYSSGSNPSLLALGQIFFSFIFALVCWAGEALQGGAEFSLPSSPLFWGSAIFIGFFIRGVYTIVQLYAQRYVSPVNTSLIFSSEIIMTMLMSPLLAGIFGVPADTGNITPLRLAGAFIMVAGILVADRSVIDGMRGIPQKIKEKKSAPRSGSDEVRRNARLVAVCAAIYLILDLPVQLTGFLNFGSYIGIKNFLPVTLGLLFGPYGVGGVLIACCVTGAVLSTPINELVVEWFCIVIPGLSMWYLWHVGSSTHKVHFKKGIHYAKYFLILAVSYVLCAWLSSSLVSGAFWTIILSHMCLSFLIGIPVITLFNGVLCLETVIPQISPRQNSEMFHMVPYPESYSGLRDTLSAFAKKRGISSKKLKVVNSCIEEMLERIFAVCPGYGVDISVNYDGMVTVEFTFDGDKCNPVAVRPDEDLASRAGLTILKHRTVQLSSFRRGGKNHVFMLINDGVVSRLTSDPETLGSFNDELDEFSRSKLVPMKKIFDMQSCIEELYLRILGRIPDADITVIVNYDGSYSARLFYSGRKYNPLIIGNDEDELDIVSLKLLRHRALRAGFSFGSGENRVHIVI